MNKNTWVFDINDFRNADFLIRDYIKDLIIMDVNIAINNNGYNDKITQNMIEDSQYLIDILGF